MFEILKLPQMNMEFTYLAIPLTKELSSGRSKYTTKDSFITSNKAVLDTTYSDPRQFFLVSRD